MFHVKQFRWHPVLVCALMAVIGGVVFPLLMWIQTHSWKSVHILVGAAIAVLVYLLIVAAMKNRQHRIDDIESDDPESDR